MGFDYSLTDVSFQLPRMISASNGIVVKTGIAGLTKENYFDGSIMNTDASQCLSLNVK